MIQSTTNSVRLFAASSFYLCLSLVACGGSEPPPAQAPPTGGGATSEQLGAPRDTHYAADIEATRGRMRVILREESVCDVIPVQSVVEDGKKKFIAGNPTSTQPCQQRVARNVILSLEVGGNTYRLGEPNAQGEVVAQMSDRILSSLYGDNPQTASVAKLMLRDNKGCRKSSARSSSPSSPRPIGGSRSCSRSFARCSIGRKRS